MLRVSIAIQTTLGVMCLVSGLPAQTERGGGITQRNQKRVQYEDAYSTWLKSDVNREQLLKLPPAEAVRMIQQARANWETMQRSRQAYLDDLRTKYESAAKEVDAKPIAAVSPAGLHGQYETQLADVTKEKSEAEEELKQLASTPPSAPVIGLREVLRQKVTRLTELQSRMLAEQQRVDSVKDSPAQLQAAREQLKRSMADVIKALGAASGGATATEGATAWRNYYSFLETEATNRKPVEIAAGRPIPPTPAPRQPPVQPPPAPRQPVAEPGPAAQAPASNAEMTAQLRKLSGNWRMLNPGNPEPQPKKLGGWVIPPAKLVDLSLHSDGTGTLNYTILVGSSGLRPDVNFDFRIDAWNGAKLSGTWASEGATGVISIAPAPEKIVVQWEITKDSGKRFSVTRSGADTLVPMQ